MKRSATVWSEPEGPDMFPPNGNEIKQLEEGWSGGSGG